MTAAGFAVGAVVFDRDREARGEVVRRYPSPLVVWLRDAAGFQWIARTDACTPAGGKPARDDTDPVRIPPGTAPLDCPPHELRVGGYVLVGAA